MSDTPTHWMATCLSPDEWPDNPAITPEKAAEMLLGIGPYDNDEVWQLWSDLQNGERIGIRVRGYIETKEDPIEQLDGYQHGYTWFKATDVIKTVTVSLKYKVTP